MTAPKWYADRHPIDTTELPANPLGIHCRDCTVSTPCERCATQVAAERRAAWIALDLMSVRP